MQEYARRSEPLREPLFRTALAILGSPSMAEEALDEAVFRGLVSCGFLREPRHFRTWLTRILLNVCTAELRRKKRELTVDVLPEPGTETFDALPLYQAMERLPGELRELVVLRYVSGYTLAETAEILKIPPGTAASRQRRALQLLRLELDEEGETTDEPK